MKPKIASLVILLAVLGPDLSGTPPGEFISLFAIVSEGAYLEVEPPDHRHLRFRVSRTSVLEYLDWIKQSGHASPDKTDFARVAGRDGTPNLYKFGLDLESPLDPVGVNDVLPRQVLVNLGGRDFDALEFVAKRRPEKNRIVYSLEAYRDEETWRPIPAPEVFARIDLGGGMERLTLVDDTPASGDDGDRRLRLVVQYEPAPRFFAHYMSDLNPGWSAMGYLMQPSPAYFRLFHEQPDRMQPAPKGPSDHFRSSGGVHRDWPLLPPGFLFSSAIESAQLEIRRARRGGVDGFAVNCLGGKTDFVEALFDGAVRLNREEPEEPPFLIALCIDVNVLPFEDGKLLVEVADLIRRWLAAGERPDRRPHRARRGGKPLVMGYQSHWIWIDYLQRLLELWEFQEEADDGLGAWPTELGKAPPVPILPVAVVEEYRAKRRERQEQLDELENPMEDDEYRQARESLLGAGAPVEAASARARDEVSRRHARYGAARRWARDPDGWRYIREAYSVLEQMVGEEIFWQFEAMEMEDAAGDPEGSLRVVGREFPAVNMFLPKGELTDIARRVTAETGAEWGEPIYSQYVAYGQNEQDGYYWGNWHGGDGTGTFRRGWYRALGQNPETENEVENNTIPRALPGRSSLIQYTTWNDYGEHSHLAPSLQMRYALLELNRYFSHLWKRGEPPPGDRDQVFLFYRKYPEMDPPKSFPFRHGPGFHPAQIEVVSIPGREGGNLELLGRNASDPEREWSRAETRPLGPGFQVEVFTGPSDGALWREGAVTARVVKESGETISATGWEEITHRPFRQDFTLVAASSGCDELWKEEMPDKRMGDFTFSEYGDADGDGLPNWFEMLYGGPGWMAPHHLEAADPGADQNRDGRSNRAHFEEGANPNYFEKPIPYRADKRGKPEPLRIDARRRTRIQAEEFDRGGLGVAFERHALEAMEAGEFREAGYDMIAHRRIEAHEEDGGDWMVAPLGDGDWQTYTVEIPASCYRLSARVRGGGGRLLVELNGETRLDAEIDDEGEWSTQGLGTIEVTPEEAGIQVLRLRFASPGFGLNWIQFERCRRGLFGR